MYYNLERDIFSIYPYNGENIQEILCRLYSMIEELKANGQVIDPNLIDKINKMIKNLQDKQISIDMFGAIGDGVNDDTTAIQSALEYCWKHNIYELYIPNGKFKVSRGIETKEVKLTGLSKPYAPNPIGFDYAYPTKPASGCPEKRKEWLDKCGGSIIECDKDIQIFIDGLIAENIMIFGDVHQSQQCGIGQNAGGPGKQIILDNVTILCCGGHAVYAPFGLISPKIRNCRMNSNMGNAIHIGKMKGEGATKYTGETNNVTIEHNDLNRNGRESIYMDVIGRVYNISFNEMEHVGFVSHMIKEGDATEPQREDQIIYCVKMKLSGGGAGFGTGEVTFKNNYSESGYGLLHLESVGDTSSDVINNVTIANNMWFPHNEKGVNIGVRLKGKIYNPTIWDNKIYTQQKYVLADSTVIGIVSNTPISDIGINNKNIIFDSKLSNNPIANLRTSGISPIGKKVPKVGFDSITYYSSDDYTRFIYNIGALNDGVLDFHFEYDHKDNIAIGNLFKLDGKPSGIVSNISTHNRLFDVKGKHDVPTNPLGHSVEFLEIGGMYVYDGSGKYVKLVADKGKVYAIDKED